MILLDRYKKPDAPDKDIHEYSEQLRHNPILSQFKEKLKTKPLILGNLKDQLIEHLNNNYEFEEPLKPLDADDLQLDKELATEQFSHARVLFAFESFKDITLSHVRQLVRAIGVTENYGTINVHITQQDKPVTLAGRAFSRACESCFIPISSGHPGKSLGVFQ